MKIRYGYIKHTVLEIYKDNIIGTYPIEIMNLIKRYPNVKLIAYSEFMKKANCSLDDIVGLGNSLDGFASKKGDKYIIFYNDFIQSKQRQIWTLAHEFAHIMIGHLNSSKTAVFRNEFSNNEYDWMEREADYLASQLLANDLILNEVKVKNAYELSKLCNLSKQASINRFKDFKRISFLKFRFSVLERLIIGQFRLFIQTTVCVNCGYKTTKKNHFCPLCGSSEFERTADTVIYDKGFELDSNSRAIKCPKCHNEDLSYDGDYCNICGTYLVNKCAWVETDINGNPYYECGTLASGNARFCIKCGHSTTYFENKLLISYETEKNIEEERSKIPF